MSPSPPLPAALLLALAVVLLAPPPQPAGGMEVLAKSSVESCARDSDMTSANRSLSCDRKLVLEVVVPSSASGGESSLVTRVVKAKDENGTQALQSVRDPPVITFSKTQTYASYALTYLKDVAYKPEEEYVFTRKCEPDAGGDVVKSCERLWDANGTVIEHTEPVCCPCGPHSRVASSCGNFIDTWIKGKRNTAHCLRFPGDWFHVWVIGERSIGFSITIQVKKGSSVSEVVVSPENRTVVSGDNFLRVNIVGDFAGYKSVPTFEDNFLVTPRKGVAEGQPKDLGDDHSKWMLLEKVRFAGDKLDCNKIGVGFEAFQNQPSFCSSPFRSCLHEQLSDLWEADKTRISQGEPPLFVVDGRFQRINQHPGAGAYSFSVGVTEAINTNLLVELSADDIEYVYQRSPGKIVNISVPNTFEALRKVGTAKVTTKNIGKLEASYSLTFNCVSGINPVEEQRFIMKPDEVTIQSFELRSVTDEATNHSCTAILKASDFKETDRAECHFATTATVLQNGTQIATPPSAHENGGASGFFENVGRFFSTIWDKVLDFFTGGSYRAKCSSLLDFGCHIQCLVVMFCRALAPVAGVALALLLLKGLFSRWRHSEHRHRSTGHGLRHLPHRHVDHPLHHHRRHNNSGPAHHHHHNSHHILHKPDEEQPEAAEEEGRRPHRQHDPALGVQHPHGLKNRNGKAAAAAVLHLEGRRQRRHEQHAGQDHSWTSDELEQMVNIRDDEV